MLAKLLCYEKASDRAGCFRAISSALIWINAESQKMARLHCAKPR
jgi:hypothetical protein